MPRRSRSYRKKSGVYAVPSSFTPSGAGGTRKSVLAAAELYAEQARKNAAKFSTRIPAATGVEPWAEEAAAVVTNGNAAPNAAPFEFGERHPLYGNRKHWYKQPTRAFMNRAAMNPGVAEAAANVYGEMEIAMLAEEFGWDE